MMVHSVLGLGGMHKKAGRYVIAFLGIAAFQFMAYLVLILAFELTFASESYICGRTKQANAFSDLNDIAVLARQELCNSGCSCNITNPDFLKDHSYLVGQGSAVQLIDCPSFLLLGISMEQYFLLQALEEQLECAGLCDHSEYFMFSDINRQVPTKESCFKSIVRELKDYQIKFAALDAFFLLETLVAAVYVNSQRACAENSLKLYRRLSG